MVINFSSDSSPSGTPCSRSKVGESHVRTWCEKEVKDSPWAAVEKTGCNRVALRKRFGSGYETGRKKERWDRTLGFRIADSKLPGIRTGDGGGEGISGSFSAGRSSGDSSAWIRLRERSRFLLKRRCSNNDVKGSKR